MLRNRLRGVGIPQMNRLQFPQVADLDLGELLREGRYNVDYVDEVRDSE